MAKSDASRQWKAGMEAANLFALEEARRRTPAERFLNHKRYLEGHASYGLARSDPDDRLHRVPYREIQERWLALYSEGRFGN